ncbi:MAG: hypothetical protein ACE366_15240 [Bradymonadia bacterium]
MSFVASSHISGRRTRTLTVALTLFAGAVWSANANAAVDPDRDYVVIDTDGLSSTDRSDFLDDVDTNVTSLVAGKGDWFCPTGDTACASALNADGITATVADVTGEADFDAWVTFKNSKTGAALSLTDPGNLTELADEVDDTAAAGSYSVLVGTLRHSRGTYDSSMNAVTPAGFDLPKWTDKGDASDSAVDFMLCESGHWVGPGDLLTDVGGGLSIIMSPVDPCPDCYTPN